jgi:hypothetical protein
VLNKKKFHRFVKDRAFTELKKTKRIEKQERNERIVKRERPKKEEEDDDDSSSGVDSSESPVPQVEENPKIEPQA